MAALGEYFKKPNKKKRKDAAQEPSGGKLSLDGDAQPKTFATAEDSAGSGAQVLETESGSCGGVGADLAEDAQASEDAALEGADGLFSATAGAKSAPRPEALQDLDGERGADWAENGSRERLDLVLSTHERVEVRGLMQGDTEAALVASFPPVSGVEGLGWSPDGRWLGLLDSQGMRIVEASENYDVSFELAPLSGPTSLGIKAFHFSPRGNYVVCYEPSSSSDATGDTEPNVGVWRLGAKEPSLVGVFPHERRSESNWPVLKWTSDESLCCRLVRDEIQVLDGDSLDLDSMKANIDCEGVQSFELAGNKSGCSGPTHLALFVPMRKDEVATCRVYSLSATSTPTAVQELSHADNVSMKWNSEGTALLLLATTDVDSTGKSYFGNTVLYFIRADGTCGRELKTGRVHDVAWCPTRNEFLMLHGELPCLITLYDGQRAKKLLDFGKNRRNAIHWSPLGRFFALGGFGQLAGDIDFWDREWGEKLGQTRYECCVDCQWSEDGRHLLGWTSAPRMRVENRVEIFDYVGSRILRIDFDKLYAASWRPMPLAGFPDLPPTPRRCEKAGSQVDTGVTPKKDAYKAPRSSGALAAQLRAEEEGGARTTARSPEEMEGAHAKKRAEEAKTKEYREVPVPAFLVRSLIGFKGTSIKELKDAVGLHLEVKQIDQGAVVRICAGPWDDLDKAAALVAKRVEELRGSRRPREVPVADELVGRLIGAGGATIQELTRQAGGLRLQVKQATDRVGQVVVIGSGPSRGIDDSDEAMDRAEQVVLAKLEELSEAMAKEALGKEKNAMCHEEMTVPVDLVGGLIGYKGSTIEELQREAGVQLKVVTNREDPNGKVIVTGSSPEAVSRAVELVQAKMESLRAGKPRGDRWADQKSSWNSRSWDGDKWEGNKSSWWEDKGWWKSRDWDEDESWKQGSSKGGDDADEGSDAKASWGPKRSEQDGQGKGVWEEHRKQRPARGSEVQPEEEHRKHRPARGWEVQPEDREATPTAASRSSGQIDEAQCSEWGPQRAEKASSSRTRPNAVTVSQGRGRDDESAHADREMRPPGPDDPHEQSADGASASAPAQAPPAEDPVAEIRATGDAAFEAGDFRTAIDLYTKAYRVNNSRDILCLCGRSAAYFQLGDAHKACSDANIAVRIHPECALGHLRKGLAMRALGQVDGAMASLAEAHRLDPTCIEAQEALGARVAQAGHDMQPELPQETPAPAKSEVAVVAICEGAPEPNVSERAFSCAECGLAADFGAIDEADGQWYCKACWVSFLSEDRPPETVGEPPQVEAAPETAEVVVTESEPIAATPAVKAPRRLWADEPIYEEEQRIDFVEQRQADQRQADQRQSDQRQSDQRPVDWWQRHQDHEQVSGDTGAKDHRPGQRHQGWGKGAADNNSSGYARAGPRDRDRVRDRDRRQGSDRQLARSGQGQSYRGQPRGEGRYDRR